MYSVFFQATFTILLTLCVLASNIAVILNWWLGDAYIDGSMKAEWRWAGVGIGILIANGTRSMKAASKSSLSPIYFFGVGLIFEASSKLWGITESKNANQLWDEYVAFFFISTWYSAFFFGCLQLFFMIITKDYYIVGIINFSLNALIIGYSISLTIRRYPLEDTAKENRRQVLFWLNSSADYLFRTIPLVIYYFESRDHNLYWHWAMLLLLVVFEVGVLATLMRLDKKSNWMWAWVLPWAVFQIGSHFAVFIRILDGLAQSSDRTIGVPPARFGVLYLELVVRAFISATLYCMVAYLSNDNEYYNTWFQVVAIAAGVNILCTMILLYDVSRIGRLAKTEQQDFETGNYHSHAKDQADKRLISEDTENIYRNQPSEF